MMDPQSLRVVKRLLTKDDLSAGMWPTADAETPVHANVDRAVLCRSLLIGLGGSVRFWETV